MRHTITLFGSQGPLAVFRNTTDMEECLTGVSFTDDKGNHVTLRKGNFPLLIEAESK